MQIKIITIHNIPNFGSIYQAYALQKYLEKEGCEVEIIDYNPSYFNKVTTRTLLGKLMNLRSYARRTKKFRAFIKKNMKLTRDEYKSLGDLTNRLSSADLYIAGGDQLWNSYHDCGRDDAFKLSFTDGYKMSYGTSIGRSNLSENELKSLKNKIMNFKAIAVRESSSVKMLERVDIHAKHCVDPVLLLKRSEYEKFVSKPTIEKYLLVYLVTPSPLLDKTIEYISKILNLKVVLCSGFSKKCKCDYFIKDLGPEEILSYVIHADFVLSASFHATLFSVLFEKEFATLLPNANTNERIQDFLNWTNFSDRIIESEKDLNEKIFDKVIYDENRKKTIEDKINDSKKYIYDNLNKLKGNV